MRGWIYIHICVWATHTEQYPSWVGQRLPVRREYGRRPEKEQGPARARSQKQTGPITCVTVSFMERDWFPNWIQGRSLGWVWCVWVFLGLWHLHIEFNLHLTIMDLFLPGVETSASWESGHTGLTEKVWSYNAGLCRNYEKSFSSSVPLSFLPVSTVSMPFLTHHKGHGQ